jgi:hypothetical protein
MSSSEDYRVLWLVVLFYYYLKTLGELHHFGSDNNHCYRSSSIFSSKPPSPLVSRFNGESEQWWSSSLSSVSYRHWKPIYKIKKNGSPRPPHHQLPRESRTTARMLACYRVDAPPAPSLARPQIDVVGLLPHRCLLLVRVRHPPSSPWRGAPMWRGAGASPPTTTHTPCADEGKSTGGHHARRDHPHLDASWRPPVWQGAGASAPPCAKERKSMGGYRASRGRPHLGPLCSPRHAPRRERARAAIVHGIERERG